MYEDNLLLFLDGEYERRALNKMKRDAGDPDVPQVGSHLNLKILFQNKNKYPNININSYTFIHSCLTFASGTTSDIRTYLTKTKKDNT